MHCTDEYDLMCYKDTPATFPRIVCGNPSHDDLFDCKHDDYFSTNASPGSYLATHWNTARSAFLSVSGRREDHS